MFHTASSGINIVQHHPQATTKQAKQQGYITLRIESWVEEEYPGFTEFLAQALNSEEVGEP